MSSVATKLSAKIDLSDQTDLLRSQNELEKFETLKKGTFHRENKDLGEIFLNEESPSKTKTESKSNKAQNSIGAKHRKWNCLLISVDTSCY